MTNYVHWTCINISNKVVHAEMISTDGKDMYNVYHNFEKQLCFFFKKLTLV